MKATVRVRRLGIASIIIAVVTGLSMSAAGAVVVGSDNRTQITNTTASPHNAVARFRYTLTNGKGYSCTGFLIGPDTVATAAHCIVERTDTGRRHNPVASYAVAPGRNGSSMPYGSCTVKRLWAHPNYTGTRGDYRNYDYGYLKLNCRYAQSLKLARSDAASLAGNAVVVSGYPFDKPDYTMWKAGGSIISNDAYTAVYDADMEQGESGGPVWQYSVSCGYCVIAINTYEYNGFPPYNFGTRITTAVYNDLITGVNSIS
jgi:glutamyl endopeptidase